MGIEPTYSAWKAAALPLCYTRTYLRLTKVPELYTTFLNLSSINYFDIELSRKIPTIA